MRHENLRKSNVCITRKRRTENFSSATNDEASSESWSCTICTFANPTRQFSCAMCGTRKGTSTRKPRLNSQLIIAQQTALKETPSSSDDIELPGSNKVKTRDREKADDEHNNNLETSVNHSEDVNNSTNTIPASHRRKPVKSSENKRKSIHNHSSAKKHHQHVKLASVTAKDSKACTQNANNHHNDNKKKNAEEIPTKRQPNDHADCEAKDSHPHDGNEEKRGNKDDDNNNKTTTITPTFNSSQKTTGKNIPKSLNLLLSPPVNASIEEDQLPPKKDLASLRPHKKNLREFTNSFLKEEADNNRKAANQNFLEDQLKKFNVDMNSEQKHAITANGITVFITDYSMNVV